MEKCYEGRSFNKEGARSLGGRTTRVDNYKATFKDMHVLVLLTKTNKLQILKTPKLYFFLRIGWSRYIVCTYQKR